MVSSVTEEEVTSILKHFEAIRERVKNDPKEARRILHEAGITTKTGKLTARYRDSPAKQK